MPLSRLNSEQYAAATSTHTQNLIIASAGTGKTSTIVGRIGHLLANGVKPEEILLLTFTNKAAAEMIERVAEYFGKEIATKIDAGTFHAVSYRWLKKHDQKVVLKQQRELKTLFRSVFEKRSFMHINAEITQYGGNYLYDVYSFYQNTELQRDFEAWIIEKYPEHELFAMIYADIVDEFESLKKEYGFVNFNDLLLNFREICKTKDLGYKEVLVDEYQDTNALQGTLIDAMKPPSLFCVGDYDQSIYAFNGADISIIGSFSTKFPHAKVHTLTKNYRSTMPILSLATKVIEHNDRIYPKKLEVTRNAQAQSPKLLTYDELFDQYHAMAAQIRDSQTPREEIAVIFRNNSSADGIEVGLRELGIACKRKGGTSFFDSREVKAVLDLYTLLINESDMMAFIHLFEFARGISSAMAKEMYLALKTLGHSSIFYGLYAPDASIHNPFEKRKVSHQLGLFDEFLELGAVGKFARLGFEEKFMKNQILKHPKLTKEGAIFLHDFYLLYRDLKGVKQPRTIVKKIAESSLYKYISDTLASKRAMLKDGSIDEKQKTEALSRIARKMVLLEELSKPYSEHERFLNAMILGSSDLTQGEGVNLLSVHASKGLEYKEVYVVDLMDGRFPNRKLMQRGGSLDEERRLFYVAVTRAKDILYLSFAKYDKIKKTNFLPSQFLYEAGLVPKDEAYRALVLKDMDKDEE
ncbi:MAG: ATP-dependent helicase [Epsilonproteobacteria bacterium]|nr:ATP-dependent helicase [Campylobacterota bacterium]OIO17659.1 MAG: ATP-dependent DNA helicase [Helicobacteraceae bacterium CG1_02_36_14]PIP09651.1 MAG: ATP-dependent DNA helicase [Sulfurimonas sp. CG23_combo_of_CG06-09_8_20_14_all_36_33]PIS26196.1 MAG: ATP-dependent DNA helicase [Sulfurimonas sp. CG08_land_8_20_14_0_20_36_33]PIU34280.1 MAG: ATP-dependent DNA helicase [Sulfurimonas sp. CG07_land_8_20_14_0_80_36_56]PIV02578.1 MAG: ATP-dependent DNA helicase [Sulfurimonas sp. CG03_land_8_20_14